MADVNAPSGQAPAMAPPVCTDDQILPRIRWVPIGKRNCYMDLEKSQGNLIYKIERRHKFHPRPDTPLHLPNEELVLGYLKFSAKGTKREVFGMPIPSSIITADIQEVAAEDTNLQKTLEESMKTTYALPRGLLPPMVAHDLLSLQKHKKKSLADQYIFQRHTFTTTGSSGQDEPSYAKHEQSQREESEKGVPKARTDERSQGKSESQAGPDPGAQAEGQTGSDAGTHDEGQAGSNPDEIFEVHAGLDPSNTGDEVKSIPSLVFHAGSDCEHMDLDVADVSPQPSMEQLVEGFTTTAYPKFKATTTKTTTTTTTTTTTLPPAPAQQQSTAEAMMIKRIGKLEHIMANLIQVNKEMEVRESYKSHEDHMQLFEALEKSMNRDHSEELAQDLAEARKKKKKSRESPKTPPRSPPHQPPPPPPPAGPSGASGASGHPKCHHHHLHLHPQLKKVHLAMDEDMGLEEQVQLSNDEDIGSAYIPKVNLRQDWWKPLEEERPAMPEPAWSIPSSGALVPPNNWASALVSNYLPPSKDSLLVQNDDIATFIDWFCMRRGITELKTQDLEGPTFEIVKVFHPDVIHLQYQMEECHKLLTDSVDDPTLRHNVSKPLPLGGPPGQIKAAYYPDARLEQMMPYQFWIDEECKYDIAAMYGICHWWFQRQRFYIDRHTSKGNRGAVRTHMRILSVVRIKVFSLYGSLEPPPTEIQEDSHYGRQPMDQTSAIDEALDYRVKEFRINRMNRGLNTRFWTRKDVDWSRAFMFAIQLEDKEDLPQPGELCRWTCQRGRLQTFEAYRMIKSFWHFRPLSDDLTRAKPSSFNTILPPLRTDWDLLFQPLFDELITYPPSFDHLTPKVIALIAEVVAPEPAASTSSPSSTTIDQDAPSPNTPLVEKSKMDEDLQGKPVDATLYHGMIGSLMYLTSSRPYLTYVVCLCARYQVTRSINSKKKKVDCHMAKDDPILTTMRFIPQHEVVQKYSAILPDNLTNQAMKESEAYKTYYGLATGKISWKSSDDEVSLSKDGDDDAENDDGQDNDNEQSESDNDGDDFVHPKFSTNDEEKRQDEEDKDEWFRSEEKLNEEEDVNELYRDVNVNLEGSFNSILNLNTELTSLEDVPVTTDVEMHPSSVTTLPLPLVLWFNLSIEHQFSYQQLFQIIKEQVKVHFKEQVSKILPRIEKLVNEQLEAEVLTRSSNEAMTSHAVAANLSELELKKILIDKMESNKSIYRSDQQKTLYKELINAYKTDKVILDTYGDTVMIKRRRDDEDDDEEPFARSNQGPREEELEKNLNEQLHTTKDLEEHAPQEFNIGRRVIPFDHFINNDLAYLRGGASSRTYATLVTKTKAADYGHIKWIKDLIPNTMWSQVPVIYDKHALWKSLAGDESVNSSMDLLSTGNLLVMSTPGT
nr:hypothetical protein [Tanacetum cinerariifolium]